MATSKLASTPSNILIVDDTPVNLQLLFNMLVEQSYKVRVAPNGELALINAQTVTPDLILLDIDMPDLNGYVVCQRLKEDAVLKSIPVIFLSAVDRPQDIVKAFQVGGVDFISKPFQCEEVLARVATHLALHRLQQELTAANAELQAANAQLKKEIEVRQQMEADLQRLATIDDLTGTLNRRQLFEVGTQELERARRYQHPFVILMLDIDYFKYINDQHGHAVGDLAIQRTVRTMRQNLRGVDHIGRYGGDEFIIILPETPLTSAQHTAERLRAAVSQQPVISGEQTLPISISVGVAGVAQENHDLAVNFDAVVLFADQALYAAKKAGRNCVSVWQA